MTWTSLYRFYDAQGRLLYVGITQRGRGRFHDHEADKAWWIDVATAAVDHYPTRAAAAIAERRAITRECPMHNTVHADTRPPDVRPLTPPSVSRPPKARAVPRVPGPPRARRVSG